MSTKLKQVLGLILGLSLVIGVTIFATSYVLNQRDYEEVKDTQKQGEESMETDKPEEEPNEDVAEEIKPDIQGDAVSPYTDRNTKDLHPETVKWIGDKNYLNVVTPDVYKEKVDSGDNFIGYFFSPTCPYCIQMTPILMAITEEEGVEVLQYNLLEYGEEGQEYMVAGTPATVYYSGGEEIARMSGLHPEENIRAFIDDMRGETTEVGD